MRNEARKMVSALDVLDAWLHDDTGNYPVSNCDGFPDFYADLKSLADFAQDANGAWVDMLEGFNVNLLGGTYFEAIAPCLLVEYYKARHVSDVPLEVLKADWDDVAVGTRC